MNRGNNIICLDSVYLAYCYVKEVDGYSFVGEKLVKRVRDDRKIGIAYQEIGSSFKKYLTIDNVGIGEMGLDNIIPLEEKIKRDCISKYVDLDYLMKLYDKYNQVNKVRKRVI